MSNLTQSEEELLRQARQVKELTQMPAWSQILLPYLQSKIHNSWVDPRKSVNAEELVYQYVVSWGFAKASEELISHIQGLVDTVAALEKKEKGETNPLREAVS